MFMSMKILLLQIDELIYFENQSPNMETRDCILKISHQIWKLEIVSFQMIYSLSILLKVFSKILF